MNRSVRRVQLRLGTIVGGGLLALIVLVAVMAPWLAPHDPIVQSDSAFATPSAMHLLGTDDLGRDVMSRLIEGTRVSLTASLLCVAVALAIGLPLGLLAGYVGGIVDLSLMRLVDTVMSFPAIILAIGITAALGPGLVTSMTAVGIVFSPAIARLMRAQTLAVRNEVFVDVARSYGASHRRLVLRHVLPNAVQPVLVQTSILLALALLAEASLSFLGLGVQPPHPSWGSMLARGYDAINVAPLQIVVPGAAIAVTAFLFNLLGDAVQNALDPTRREVRT